MSINPIQKEKINQILKHHDKNIVIDPELLEIQLEQCHIIKHNDWQNYLRSLNIISSYQAFEIIDQQIQLTLQNDLLYDQSPYPKLKQLSQIGGFLENLLNEFNLDNVYFNIEDLIQCQGRPLTYHNLIKHPNYVA